MYACNYLHLILTIWSQIAVVYNIMLMQFTPPLPPTYLCRVRFSKSPKGFGCPVPWKLGVQISYAALQISVIMQVGVCECVRIGEIIDLLKSMGVLLLMSLGPGFHPCNRRARVRACVCVCVKWAYILLVHFHSSFTKDDIGDSAKLKYIWYWGRRKKLLQRETRI